MRLTTIRDFGGEVGALIFVYIMPVSMEIFSNKESHKTITWKPTGKLPLHLIWKIKVKPKAFLGPSHL